MFENITFEIILERMLSRVSEKFPNLDTREGSIIYNALAPAAVELQLLYIELDVILNESFGDTASREYLIRRAAERRIVPYPATKAILQGEFTPTNVAVLGKRFSLDSLNYIVTGIVSEGVYKVECETLGEEGNTLFGDMIPIEYIAGLKTAKLTQVLIPGDDEEDTESLRKRYLESFDAKAYGGNRKDYLEKTNAIAGVGAAKVTPIWNGGGTVKLTILNSSFDKASTTLIQTVQAEIDPTQDGQGWGVAPIGHVVTVETAEEIKINVTISITFENGYSWANLSSQISQAIQNYLLELRKTWAEQSSLIVRISQIENRILSIKGVLDLAKTKINGIDSNLTLFDLQIPAFGGVLP